MDARNKNSNLEVEKSYGNFEMLIQRRLAPVGLAPGLVTSIGVSLIDPDEGEPSGSPG